MINQIKLWWKQLWCNHQNRESRMLWIEEVADFYEQCLDCGKELHE